MTSSRNGSQISGQQRGDAPSRLARGFLFHELPLQAGSLEENRPVRGWPPCSRARATAVRCRELHLLPPKRIEGLHQHEMLPRENKPIGTGGGGTQRAAARRRDPVSLSNPSDGTNQALSRQSLIFCYYRAPGINEVTEPSQPSQLLSQLSDLQTGSIGHHQQLPISSGVAAGAGGGRWGRCPGQGLCVPTDGTAGPSGSKGCRKAPRLLRAFLSRAFAHCLL